VSRFLIACGGTGGHLAPASRWPRDLSSAATSRTCSSRTSRSTPASSRNTRGSSSPASRRAAGCEPARLARFVWRQSAGFAFALKHIQQVRPDVVVGFGGFTTASIVLAARMRGIPVALHEANRVPGRAVRLLSRLARRVYLPPGVRLSRARGGTVRPQGLPVRREFVRAPRSAALETLQIEPARRLVAVLGGSQGASALNDWAETNMELLALEGACLLRLPVGQSTPARSSQSARARAPRSSLPRPILPTAWPSCSRAPTSSSAFRRGTLSEWLASARRRS
jgi:UDP-N-acetylglucosamine--N-acetylmuramyl-(pentapeptide) pyrophosphoryl-undecaprenol N-acetylglucosamine transferase